MAIQRLNLAPVKTCPQAKRRHYSRAVAEAVARSLAEHDRFNRPHAGPIGVYHCEACGPGVWHVGHLH